MTKKELEDLKEKARSAEPPEAGLMEFLMIIEPKTVIDLIERLEGMQKELQNISELFFQKYSRDIDWITINVRVMIQTTLEKWGVK